MNIGTWDCKGEEAEQECYTPSKAPGSTYIALDSLHEDRSGEIRTHPSEKGELGVLKPRYFIICWALLSQSAGAISSRLQPRIAILLL